MWGAMAVFALLALVHALQPAGLGMAFVHGMTALYAGVAARGAMSRAPALVWGVLAWCVATASLTAPEPAVPTIVGLVAVGLVSFVIAWDAGPTEPTDA